MSYAFTIPLRGLGVSASASVNVAADVNSGASVSKTTQDVAKAADVEIPDCSEAALTGNAYMDSTIVKCCEDIKKMSNMTAKEKVIGVGQCIARGAATGACMAAGVVTYGVTTALAPLCGTLGAALYERVVGWDTAQWVAAGVAGSACALVSAGLAGPLCAFVAAELIGWVSDALGPLIDGIFNPSAAKDRELAARKAFHDLTDTREEFLLQSDQSVRALWSNSIKSIKDMYQGTVGLLPSSYQVKAQRAMGFAPTYDAIAKALVESGAPITPLNWRIDGNGGTVAARLRWQRDKGNGHGCETTAAGCLNDGYSEVCPFSFSDMYMEQYYAAGMDKIKGDTRSLQVAFEKLTLEKLRAHAAVLLPKMQRAIAMVTTRVATIVIAIKQQALLEEAKNASDALLVNKATSAAKLAETFADRAKSWSGSTRAAALRRTQSYYQIALKAHGLMTLAAKPGTAPPSTADLAKMKSAVAHASAAVKTAQANAHSAQIMVGGVAAAGVVGVGYLLLRRT